MATNRTNNNRLIWISERESSFAERPGVFIRGLKTLPLRS
jgi:hypothetical protein